MGNEHLAYTNKEISPNFLAEASKNAEQRMRELFDRARDLGVEVITLQHERKVILERIKKELPKRYSLVIRKLQQEGLKIGDVSKSVLIDRMLGIDTIFEFNDKKFALDVTTGKSTVVINKQTKILEMEKLYRRLGIDYAIVLRIREDVTDDLVLDFFSKLEEAAIADSNNFCLVIKYPAPEGLGFHGPTRAALRKASKKIEAD